MDARPADLERIFSACFELDYRTVLVGGGDEPMYLPAPPTSGPSARHRIVYREDYFASALHEVAHWCLAGRERRLQEDYGYWYEPDGRSPLQQAEFERVEARPQALEWIFSDACGFDFHLSADNLDGDVGPSASFGTAVERERRSLLRDGLPRRAATFRDALVAQRDGADSRGRDGAEGCVNPVR